MHRESGIRRAVMLVMSLTPLHLSFLVDKEDTFSYQDSQTIKYILIKTLGKKDTVSRKRCRNKRGFSIR